MQSTDVAEPVGFEVSPSFIGVFKSGDNIAYNLDVLRELYLAHGALGDGRRFLMIKPIVVVIAAVVEAILYDLAFRATHLPRESLGQLDAARRKSFSAKLERSGKHLSFQRLVNICREEAIFGDYPTLYDGMTRLVAARNRMHITNVGASAPRDEHQLFVERAKEDAEVTCEDLMRVMATSFSRGRSFTYVRPFWFPWKMHVQV